MDVAERIRKAREAKGLSQKEVALALNMDQSQYSKIEKGKTDPTTSTLEKVAQAIGVELPDLFSQQVFKDVSSFDKTMVEKLQLLEQLEESERQSIYHIVDGLMAKKRLKDTLASALNLAQ